MSQGFGHVVEMPVAVGFTSVDYPVSLFEFGVIWFKSFCFVHISGSKFEDADTQIILSGTLVEAR